MRRLVFALLALVAFVSVAHAADVPGSKDPPFLKRFKGSEIVVYVTRSFDQYTVLVDNDLKKKTVEGAVTRIMYRVPLGHTAFELLRNYEQAFKEAGFAITGEIAPCKTEYGIVGTEDFVYGQVQTPLDTNPYSNGSSTNHGPDGPMCYFSAHGTADGKDITASVIAIEKHANPAFKAPGAPPVVMKVGEILVGVDIVAAKAVENQMVVVKAADMADALATKGKVDLYGVYFDTDKAIVKPESKPTLDEVANLLKIDRSLKLEIAGHTDNTGDKAHNQKLSEDRAKAVVDALVKQYGIDPKRLQAKGYGDTKPVASNDTDAGRAKNRRVELRKL
ncbi:MAG: OmpA family protein [Alphaproteobacteria bacterium]|nr:OmpA family protein [Alphaproteobacteria bacterium]